MIFFTVNPIIFGEVWTAKKYVICWNITTYKNMDVKLLHPRWKDFLDTVNTVVLTGYWKQLIFFLFDLQCFFQSGSECGPWIKMIGNICLVIQKIHLFFLWFFLFSMVDYILVCSLKGVCAKKYPGFVSMVTASDVDSSLSAIVLEYWWSYLGKFFQNIWKWVLNIAKIWPRQLISVCLMLLLKII